MMDLLPSCGWCRYWDASARPVRAKSGRVMYGLGYTCTYPYPLPGDAPACVKRRPMCAHDGIGCGHFQVGTPNSAGRPLDALAQALMRDA